MEDELIKQAILAKHLVKGYAQHKKCMTEINDMLGKLPSNH
jgi:hypothetical protein